MIKRLLPLLLLLLCSCSHRATDKNANSLVSIQLIDRNGFSETISTKDRLALYENINFLTPQPYEKVLRVFGKDSQGKSHSTITSYHANGHVAEYLEIIDGRANGPYREWFQNGRLKLEVHVIEGIADISEVAQASWLFDGKSNVWNEEGHLIAEILYEKGLLQNDSLYYHPNGKLAKRTPYDHNEIHGVLQAFSDEGTLLEEIPYQKGVPEGIARGFWAAERPSYVEEYTAGLLQKATYYTPTGVVIAQVDKGSGQRAEFEKEKLYSLTEYQNGLPEGEVQLFRPDGTLQTTYQVQDGKKEGEEWEYFPSKDPDETPKPKLYLSWHEDAIQGIVKTWYENGILESQREISNNKKEGLSFAWFKEGEVMFMEEYEADLLMKASYFKRGDKLPVSKIENGKGTATLYDAEGRFLKKISYEKGKPVPSATP